jgi:hypothetical protein
MVAYWHKRAHMPQKQSNNEDKLLIESLLEQLNTVMGWSYKTDYYPDEVNRKSKDIDLIAKSDGLADFAFEETRVTSFEDQIGFEEKFKRLYLDELHQLQQKIKPGIDCYLPHDLFTIDDGDYCETSVSIFNFLIANQENFSPGSQTINVPELAFKIKVIVSEKRTSKFNFKIYLNEKDIAISLAKALNHKKEKLSWYSNRSQLATLVLSNYDTQNISVVCVYQAYLKLAEQGLANHLQYVFYYDFSSSWFCFKGKNIIKNGFNPVKL